MKFKQIVKLIEKLLGMKDHGDGPRADMYLPDFLLAFAIVLLLSGVGLGITGWIVQGIWFGVAAGAALLLGIAAVLCWKNQTIRIISSTQFEYTTFLGNTYTYGFDEITALRQNSDSMTLFVGKKKVHIESMAVISQRLSNALSAALQR